jgi:haloalkane dehalogenase
MISEIIDDAEPKPIMPRMQRRDFLQLSASAVLAASLPNMAPRPRRRFVSTRFGDIAYFERGSGPTALFIHGFPLNGYQWRDVLPRLASYRRCIAPDLMGLGFTKVASGQGVTPDDQLAMIVGFLDALSIATVDVVGSDSGGAVAQLLAARHRDRVRTLLLSNCDVEIDSPPQAALQLIVDARAGIWADRYAAAWVADHKKARAADALGGMCYVDPARLSDETIDTYLSPLVSSPERKAQLNAYAVGLDPNPLKGIPYNDMPVRVVWGMADTIFRPADADFLDHAYPKSRGVRRVPTGKLFWPEEFPDIIAEEARALWRG